MTYIHELITLLEGIYYFYFIEKLNNSPKVGSVTLSNLAATAICGYLNNLK